MKHLENPTPFVVITVNPLVGIVDLFDQQRT